MIWVILLILAIIAAYFIFQGLYARHIARCQSDSRTTEHVPDSVAQNNAQNQADRAAHNGRGDAENNLADQQKSAPHDSPSLLYADQKNELEGATASDDATDPMDFTAETATLSSDEVGVPANSSDYEGTSVTETVSSTTPNNTTLPHTSSAANSNSHDVPAYDTPSTNQHTGHEPHRGNNGGVSAGQAAGVVAAGVAGIAGAAAIGSRDSESTTENSSESTQRTAASATSTTSAISASSATSTASIASTSASHYAARHQPVSDAEQSGYTSSNALHNDSSPSDAATNHSSPGHSSHNSAIGAVAGGAVAAGAVAGYANAGNHGDNGIDLELGDTTTHNDGGDLEGDHDELLDFGDLTADISEMLKELNLRETDSPRLEIDEKEYQQLKTGEPGEVKPEKIENVAGKLRDMLQ